MLFLSCHGWCSHDGVGLSARYAVEVTSEHAASYPIAVSSRNRLLGMNSSSSNNYIARDDNNHIYHGANLPVLAFDFLIRAIHHSVSRYD